jgi:TRIAD3 protein (E3 ubiquitin-protein ligase RNF216)
MKSYVESCIREKKIVKCLYENCEGVYKNCDMIKALPQDVLKEYEENISVIEIKYLASILDNYHICPFCSKFGIVIDNLPNHQNQHIYSVKCENIECGKKWCIKCRCEDHGNNPCGKITVVDKEKIKHLIDETIDSALIHQCPKCFTKYSKEDGCNMMTCPTCQSYSCYICNLLIVPRGIVKYWHFKGSGSGDPDAVCPLYNYDDKQFDSKNGNKKLNEERILKSVKNLLEVNKDNPDVIAEIKNSLIKRGYQV